MQDFMAIWQYVSANYSGSTKDLFVMAIDMYEDEYDQVDESVADIWFAAVA